MAFVYPDETLKTLPISLFVLFVLHLLVLPVRVHLRLEKQEHTQWMILSRILFRADLNYLPLYHWQKAQLTSMCHSFSSMFVMHALPPRLDHPCHENNQRM